MSKVVVKPAVRRLTVAESHPQECDSSVVPVFQWKTENGKRRLVKTGTRDTQAEIQAAAVGITLPEMVARGLSAVPQNAVPVYGDATHSGVDVLQVQESAKNAQAAWQSLPQEIRTVFDDDPAKFLAGYAAVLQQQQMKKSAEPVGVDVKKGDVENG